MARFELTDENELVEVPTFWSTKMRELGVLGRKNEELQQENTKLWELLGNKAKYYTDQECNTDPPVAA